MQHLTFHQLTQDLDWILTSPALLNPQADSRYIGPEKSGNTDYSEEQLQLLIEQLSHRRNHLLGIYYETLWQFVLEQSGQVLAKNLQVQSSDRTLGEYDLLLQTTHSQPIKHRELAVKYYLGIPGQNDQPTPWNHWVGPGLKDRMDRKLNHLLHHQITLSQTEPGKAALEKLGIKAVEQEILLQGYLFYPAFTPCPAPEQVNPKHLKGHWVAISQLEDWLSQVHNLSTAVFYPLEKSLWLSPVRGKVDISQQFSSERLLGHMKAQMTEEAQPRLISQCRQKDEELHEESRFFVVPDDWEERAVLAAQS